MPSARPANPRSNVDVLECVFPGESELATRMRAFPWETRDLGAPASWPKNLRVAVGICLMSRFPIHVWWGPDLTLFYNDAYISFLGAVKHPAVLGRSGREAWSEVWPTIGPMVERARATATASWSEDILMFFDRAIPQEEVYVTFSFSPILGEGGEVDGLFCACTETTEKLVGNRRLETLRKLGIRAAEGQSVDKACEAAAEVLAQNPHDIPFAAIYVLHDDGARMTLSGAAGLDDPSPLPASVSFGEGHPSLWPFATVLRRQRPADIDLGSLGQAFSGGPWPEPASKAVVVPIPAAVHGSLAGLLVVGVSPRRVLEAPYRSFFDLVAGHIGTAIADAQAYEAERRRAEALAEIDRAKTAFFSSVSHEFRTPLTLILGQAENAIAAPVRALAGEELGSVHRNALRLLKLVNSLLEFSRIEAGRMDASYEPTDLAVLTAELASAFRSAMERAGLAFEVDCGPLSEPVFVDHDMWEKIVLNLLSNALKFTFEGAVSVTLRERDREVELTVRDTGTGIAAEELPHVFKRFHRIRGARSRTHEGSGIGLALVHELSRLHGGSVRVESALDAGTTFTVAIPRGSSHLSPHRIGARKTLASCATGAAPYVQEALRWLPSRGEDEHVDRLAATALTEPGLGAFEVDRSRRVLVADDNADMRDYIRRLLTERWTVETVGDGVEALAAVRRARPDLVVTDVMMPRLDGFGLLRELRADEATWSIPVLMLSARSGEESRVEGLEAGADDYLIKPFSARELVARVTTHMQIASLRRAAEDALVREQDARREAEAANNAKDEFLAMLGHELRNPLAPITTALYLMGLRHPGVAEKERGIIDRQVAHLASLVNDLLDVSRVTRGKVELRRQRVEISEAVAKAIEMASPLLEQRRHHLALAVPPRGLSVDADVTRLAQVIGNLLTNAAKYTPSEGRIAVEAEHDGAHVVVRVRDNGIGIAPEVLPKVFDLFVQERQALDRSQGGLGLGLAIVRSLVSMHGGIVSAHSDGRGHGSEFTIRLPASANEEASSSAPVSAESARSPSNAGLRILVVDDNVDAAGLLADTLTAFGHVTRVAHDGPVALRMAEELLPEVALIDIGLPVMDGYELAHRLRQHLSLTRVHLIAVTGYGQNEDKRRSQEAGFDAHLVKPVELPRLTSLLAELRP